MRRKLLCTILCVTMVFSTLIGCGAKENASDNVVVETEENETNIENETNTNTNEDVVVDAERPEGMVVGKTNYTDWGSYTVVDSINGLDNIEVEFYGQAFKATVPQDMGGTSYCDGSKNIEIYNKDESKILKAWYSENSIEDKEKDDKITEEEMKSFLSSSTYEEGYYYSKEWINDNLLKFTFEANRTTDNGKEYHGYAVFMSDYEKGLCYQFYYGESVDICDMDVVKLVANSLDFLVVE